MEKRGLKTFIFTTLIVYLLPLAAAEILLSQPDSLYNLGDELNMTVTISSQENTNGFVLAKLVCDPSEVELYKSPLALRSGEAKSIFITTRLDPFLMGNLQGVCFIKSTYNNENAESQRFEITKDVSITLDISAAVLDPGKQFSVSGKAKKRNGRILEGFTDLSLPELNISLSASTSGAFIFNVTLPKNAPSRMYTLKVTSYEKSYNDEITNQGTAETTVRVKQIVERIDVSLNTLSLKPGEELLYTVLLYDQAGEKAHQDATIKIFDPQNALVVQKVVRAGDSYTFRVAQNATPHFWKVIATWSTLESKRSLYIEEVENVSITLVNNTLIIMNTGNVPYKKPIEIGIGENREIKEISLAPGISEKIKLYAPDGEYPIEVKQGNVSVALGRVHLTGKGVSAKAIGDILGSNMKLIIWTIIIVVLAFVALVYYRKIAHHAYIGKVPFSLKEKEQSHIPIPRPPSFNFSHAGEKQECVILALNIKNLHRLSASGDALGTIKALLQQATENAHLYHQGHYHIAIFSQKGNELHAIKAARMMEDEFNTYNKHHALKIDFGIGIHTGEMIIETLQGKHQFTSVGNTTIGAKKASEHASSEVLMTKAVHRKVAGIVKSNPVLAGQWYKITGVTDRQQHAEFIKRFMSRQK